MAKSNPLIANRWAIIEFMSHQDRKCWNAHLKDLVLLSWDIADIPEQEFYYIKYNIILFWLDLKIREFE